MAKQLMPIVPVPMRYYVVDWDDNAQVYGDFIKLADARKCAKAQGFKPADPKMFKRNHPIAFVATWDPDSMGKGDWLMRYNPRFDFEKEGDKDAAKSLVELKALAERVREELKNNEMRGATWIVKGGLKVKVYTHWSEYEREYTRKSLGQCLDAVKPEGSTVEIALEKGNVYDALIGHLIVSL